MASSSSSSSSSRWTYDVFLSFRGETRKSFTDHLYSKLCDYGINTFRDNEELRKGEDISDELMKAIEGSEISIIVFSKKYAESRWCLKELVKILECKQKLGQKILPIFYHVNPSDVRNQKGEFGTAFDKHKARFETQQIDEWKAALTTVVNLSGNNLENMDDGYESKFIKTIAEWVQGELSRTYMHVAKHPVGIGSHVRDIDRLLHSQTNNDVKMIGIFGMGGVGKTTLAKAIYNKIFQRFEGSCFIESIGSKASYKEQHNLVGLQKELLCETLKREKFIINTVAKGIVLIKQFLKSKKNILVVLDDINHKCQLESLAGERDWFGSGSIIIITTRDVHLLVDLRANEKYEVNTLSFEQSLQFLSLHAFDVPVPLEEYNELSKRIASYTGGLPLALEVIGSLLHGKSVQYWRDVVEKLRKIPNGEVQYFLKISYDALDDDTQRIFLDIACFFIGHGEKDTSMVLDACGFYPGCGITTLKDKCLLKINRDEKIAMHSLIQDMGKEIVRMESAQHPGKRSRLVDPKEAIDVLQEHKGTDAVEGMMVNSNKSSHLHFSTEVFKMMTNLRILMLNGVSLTGPFEYLSKDLRLFWLRNSHLTRIPFDFRFGKLVELDFSDSNIREFQTNMQYFGCLKNLKLDSCKELEETLDFTGAHSLRKVSFSKCSNLVKVHSSIGSLERLVELDLTHCEELKMLPNSICSLKSLEVLKLDSCMKLKKLPEDFGNLVQLRELHARITPISYIPDSAGYLRNLKIMDLTVKLMNSPPPRRRTCSRHKPFLPPSVENLCSMEKLSMQNRALDDGDLPIGLGRLTSLSDLDLSGSYYLQALPFSPRQLFNLKYLNLDELRGLGGFLELPPSLEVLRARNCVSLKKIDVSNSRRLRTLYIPNCTDLVELPGLDSCEALGEIEVRNCSSLAPPIENWFKAHCDEGDKVKIWFDTSLMWSWVLRSKEHSLRIVIPSSLHFCVEQARLSIRNKITGAWIEEGGAYTAVHSISGPAVRLNIKVPVIIGEVLEVCADFRTSKFHTQPCYVCLFEIHRNTDGEVRFFPSTRGKPTPSLQQGSSCSQKRKLEDVEDLYLSIVRGFGVYPLLTRSPTPDNANNDIPLRRSNRNRRHNRDDSFVYG